MSDASAVLPYVLSLGAEDLCKRCAPLNCDHYSVDEPAQARQTGAVREALQGGWQVGTGTSVGQASAQLVGELSAGQPADPLECAGCSLACTHCQCEQLCHRGELAQHALLTSACRVTQGVITQDRSQGESDDGQQDQNRDRQLALGQPDEAADDEAEDPSGGRPDHLFRPESLDIRWTPGAQLTTSHRRGTSEDPFHAVSEPPQGGREDLTEAEDPGHRRAGSEQP